MTFGKKICIMDKSSCKYYNKTLAVFKIIEYNVLSTPS